MGGGAGQVPTCRVGQPRVTERKDKMTPSCKVARVWILNTIRSLLSPNDSPVSVRVFIPAK